METRRLVLLMIFSLSLIMLWDNYQASIGKPTLFGLSTGSQTSNKGEVAKQSEGSNTANDLPQAAAPAGTASVPADPNAIVASATETAPAAQTITVKTDVLELQFSSQGAQLISSKLLDHPAAENPELPVQLFEQTTNRTYVGQAGLVGVPDAPNHRTLFDLVSGSTEFAPGQDQLKLVFKATSGGVENTATYTIFKNRYDIDLVITARNVGTEPVSPSAYVQITRDGNPLKAILPCMPPSLARLFTHPRKSIKKSSLKTLLTAVPNM